MTARDAVRAREQARKPQRVIPVPAPEPKRKTVTERTEYVRYEPTPDTETLGPDEGTHE